ncbi:MAG: hypothetical protein JWP25_6613 [Bradyrhizobium sp.]|nr:hypothetical protein [Bradyrhizobium sp.]
MSRPEVSGGHDRRRPCFFSALRPLFGGPPFSFNCLNFRAGRKAGIANVILLADIGGGDSRTPCPTYFE